jgi:multiple sugar transport system substrate-binding protein
MTRKPDGGRVQPRRSWTRRRLLGAAVIGGATGLGARSLGPALAQPALVRGSKLTYWGGLIFSDKANQLLVDTINAWGEENGIETEVVMINQNETVQKVSAAVASNTMPDAMDTGLDLLLVLSKQGVFLPLDELYATLGEAQGGWFPAVADASDTTSVFEGRTGIPYGVAGNLLLRRNDLLSAAGLTEPPETWQELVDQAVAVTEGQVFGLGLALSNVGDGNQQVSVMQSFGGRMADDTGTNAAIKSDQTRAYLEWVKDAWDKGVFPPGNTTWDGAGDNQAYLSGQTAFIANTGSVGIAAKAQDPELYDVTAFSPLPSGPEGRVSPISLQLRAIPRTSKNPDAARVLIEHLAQPEFIAKYYEVAINGPVLQDQAAYPAFDGKDPILKALFELVQTGTPPGYPDVYNVAYADAFNNFVVPKMVQRVVIDGWDFDRAMDEAQTQTQAIYDKYR